MTATPIRCPRCDAEVASASVFCSSCGVALAAFNAGVTTVDLSDASTVGQGTTAPMSAFGPISATTPRESEPGRIPSGTVLAGRYRVGSCLGEGGFGTVYLVSDLVLGQEVALKLLREPVVKGVDAQGRLAQEVAVARRVTHAGVCRVHDIGEVAGQPFLTMEYVDGEDLGSLLRRIGRLPADKAVEVAREICAATHAAHEQGILHRDLKPQNIMIDGEGRVRITDFGIAALTADLEKNPVAGTPAYMAPELFTGGQASVQSDLYSLGVLMYELVTGKPRFEVESMTQLLREHRQPLVPPSRVVDGVPHEVEEVILRCLEHDPADRPRSALEVLASLPGGDPLKAALAAGETPSPELVANAGRVEALRAAPVLLGVAAFLVGLVLALALLWHASLLALVPLEKSTAVLADRGREIVAEFGADVEPADRAYAFDLYEEYLAEIVARDPAVDRWERLRRARPAAVDFWYRASPRALVPRLGRGVSWTDPPAVVPGMTQVRLDPLGRLRELLVVPLEVERVVGGEADVPSREFVEQEALFEAAGLDIELFEPLPSQRVPQVFADERLAWRGAYPEPPGLPIRVEIAALEGRPVAFRIIEERWAAASVAPTGPPPVVHPMRNPRTGPFFGSVLAKIVALFVMVGALALAWDNWRRGRMDVRGGVRVGTSFFVLALVSDLLRAHHPVTFRAEALLLGDAIGASVLLGLQIALVYGAIEPHVRRFCPETLIAWMRVLGGRGRDSLVGLSVLVGGVLGVWCFAAHVCVRLSDGWFGDPPSVPMFSPQIGDDALAGVRVGLGLLLELTMSAQLFALTSLTLLLLILLVVRHRTSAAVAYTVLQGTMWAVVDHITPVSWLLSIAMAAACTFVLIRFGLLALAVGSLYFLALLHHPLTLDTSAWYFETTVVIVGLLLALCGYGAWRAWRA